MQDNLFSSLFFRLYGLLWRLARPVLRHRRRLADGWTERLIPDGWAQAADLWIQAASGGEARLAVALLRELGQNLKKQKKGVLRVLVTTWTRQGRDVLANSGLGSENSPLSLTVRFAPLDDPAITRRAVAQVKPRLLVLLETELWPGLMRACAEANVPIQVLNARMTRASHEGYRIIRFVMRRLPVHSVHAVSEEDAQRFARIFLPYSRPDTKPEPESWTPPVIETMPNMKLDAAAEALSTPAPCPADPICIVKRDKPVILLASVRKEEEHRLCPVIHSLIRLFPQITLIIAPRHLHRVEAWKERLYDLGLWPVLASELQAREDSIAPLGQPLIWDRFGDLPQLYALADTVFVGGSLGLGGQNFLEALSAGVIPLVGPSLDNFRWALGKNPSLEEAGLIRIFPRLRTMKALGTHLEEFCREGRISTSRDEVRSRFRDWLSPRTGGTALAARHVLDLLDRDCSPAFVSQKQ